MSQVYLFVGVLWMHWPRPRYSRLHTGDPDPLDKPEHTAPGSSLPPEHLCRVAVFVGEGCPLGWVCLAGQGQS